MLCSFCLVVCLYLTTGLCGFALFGSSTPGNVLQGFALGDAAADAVKLLMALHLALVIPVDALPTRRAFALALRVMTEQRRRAAELAARGGAAEGAGSDNDGYDELEALQRLGLEEELAEERLPHVCGSPCSPPIALQTAAFVMGAATAACAFPSVTVVFGLLGATLGITCMIGYPALFLLARADAIDAAAQGRLLDGADEEAEAGDKAAGADSEPLVFWSPRTPFWLRVHGYTLLGLSAVLIVLGTTAYVYETTWLS